MKRMMSLCCGLLCAGAAVAVQEEDWIETLVGKTEVGTLPDAPPRDVPLSTFSGISEEKMKALAPEGTVKLWRNIFAFVLGETKETKVLVDTGMGEAGSLLAKVFGDIEPPDIILLTHLHADHTGGLMDGDKARFPNAKVYMPKPALDHWKDTTDERMRKIFNAYGDRILGFTDGEEIIPGLFGRFAFGHTPGHALYETADILFVGDLLHAASLQFAHPEICASFDMDKPAAVAQRKLWLKKAADSGKPIAGCHLPYIGKVKVKGEGFEFEEVKNVRKFPIN